MITNCDDVGKSCKTCNAEKARCCPYQAYQKGREDSINFINEIIDLCKENDLDGDEVPKETLCRKLLKYGFIKKKDDYYILESLGAQYDAETN